MNNSSNVVVDGFSANNSLWGIYVEGGSQGVTLQNNTVSNTGQEAIHIRGNSSDVNILDNNISDTGNRPGKNDDGIPYSTFGEGIYLGTGAPKQDPGGEGTGDRVKNITIRGNDISQTTGEAIDVKPYVSDVVIDDNEISDIATGTSGALVIGLPRGSDTRGNFMNADNVTVSNNTFTNISDTSRTSDGNAIRARSAATIYNNDISNYSTRGIYIDGAPSENEFKIYHNTVYSADKEGQDKDIVINKDSNDDLQNNVGYENGSNIAASADLFANPSSELREGSAAIDAGVATEIDIDIDGVSRDIGGAPDLGAYEYSGSNSSPEPAPSPEPSPAPTPTPSPDPNGTTLTGDSEGNFLAGTDENDAISGYGGEDTINGSGGQDTIDGGSSNDNLDGGYGSDRIIGGSGNDFISDDSLPDTVNNGNDSLIGGVGADTLAGGGGNDSLSGYGGDYFEIDKLSGQNGADNFVLASSDNLYYDRSNKSGSDRDYAVIQDFDSSDVITLNGSESDYSLRSGELGNQSSTDSANDADTLIYFGDSELIGVVEDNSGISFDNGVSFV